MTETPIEPAADSQSSDDDYVARLGLSEPETTLGKLQRGRGAGWLECLELPREEARDLLWQCIAIDPRFDRQVERRESYYAELALLTGLEVSRLLPEELPPVESWRDRGLVAAVLSELDRSGLDRAKAVLYEHEAGEQRRHRPPSQPEPRAPMPPTTAPVEELLEYEWTSIPRRVMHRLTNMLRPGERDTLVRACAELERPWLPFAVLGRLNDPAGIEAATEILDEGRRGGRLGIANKYFGELGAEHTLPLGRAWLDLPGLRSRTAASILGRHAEAEDLLLVRSRLDQAWTNRDIYPLCNMIDALGRHPEHGPFEELGPVFRGVEYSYARTRAAKVMVTSDPMFASTLARECLWDCEEVTQGIGVPFVDPDDSDAVARVAEISARRSQEAAALEEYRSRGKRQKDG